MNAAVMTVSDGVAAGTRDDASGRALVELLADDGYDVTHRVVPDEPSEIVETLRELAALARLVLTTGGTGVSPRDHTPEATLSVVDRVVPGIAEAVRADATAQTPHGLLGRGVAGIYRETLIVNLPGSVGGCRDGYRVIRPALTHALELIAARPTEHLHTT